MRPLILHLDIDAFFASVEQLRNPRLAGRPVAVGAGVIASCSYEARHFGLRAGMPLRRAERLCPGLVVVEGHQAIYRCYAEQVFEFCHGWAPQVETHLDEAYCDLGGTERLYPRPAEVATALRQRIHGELGLRVSVGMGRNRMFARLATRTAKPDGMALLPETEEEATLCALPLGELPGIGPRTHRLLERLGIHTIPELRALPVSALLALLGVPGRTLFERCRGVDHRVVGSREIPRSIRRETTFHADTDDPREIDGMLQYLTERAARTLRDRGLVAGALAVKIVHSDHARDERRRRLAVPTQLDGVLVPLALALRRELHQRRVALRHVGVALDRIQRAPEALQATLFEDEGTLATTETLRQQRLLRSIDAIRDRYGHSALITGRSVHFLGSLASTGRRLDRDRHGFILRTPSLTM